MIEFNYSIVSEEVIITLKTDITKIGTFHKMVTVLYKFDWDIIEGNIQTIEENGKKIALDILKLRLEDKKNAQSAIEIGYLMESIFSSNDDLINEIYTEILGKRKKNFSYFKDKAELIIEDDKELKQTVLYIEADSAKGLLFYLTKVLRELDIDIISANIQTDPFSKLANDTFYLLDKDGNMFANTKKEEELKTLIYKSLRC